MGSYNLLDEKWISVIEKQEGRARKVSLKEVFSHAEDYRELAGEMKIQDFAVLRLLLAVLHTVFSKVGADGSEYGFFEIDPHTFQQLETLDSDNKEEYRKGCWRTWFGIWRAGKFPEVIGDYLEAWRDHFNLLDDEYPFYQVSMQELEECARGGSQFFGKNLNRLISESNNKGALFSPKSSGDDNKDKMTMDELVRWLITLQGYIGTSDKKSVRDTKVTCSRGWLFDLGGLYLRGGNLFQTLMLNFALPDIDDKGDPQGPQIPAWERSGQENIDLYFDRGIDNFASLYTNWSRAIAFAPDFAEGKPFSCFLAKLPEVNHVDNFLEYMTIWRRNQTGENKGRNTPRKHPENQSLWRNFGIVMGLAEEGGSEDKPAVPGILSWYKRLDDQMRFGQNEPLDQRIGICAVSLMDDGNSMSRTPTNEVYDEIRLQGGILADVEADGWIQLIHDHVNRTKRIIQTTLGYFLSSLSLIRGKEKSDRTLEKREIANFYYLIDGEFRDWLDSIGPDSVKNDKIREWNEILKRRLKDFAEEIYETAPTSDFVGRKVREKTLNIAMLYNSFCWNLNKAFK